MNIKDMTIKELNEMGARIDVNFYFNKKDTEDLSYETVNQFEGLNKVEANDNDGIYWHFASESTEERVTVTAFYNDKKSRADNTAVKKDIQS